MQYIYTAHKHSEGVNYRDGKKIVVTGQRTIYSPVLGWGGAVAVLLK